MRNFAIAFALLTVSQMGMPLEAQIMASEKASTSQTVDGTTMTVSYFRPQARGRTGLFGTRVYWGEVWTPGANIATTLNVDKDITLEGRAVPKGTYSVWIVVQKGPWEMVLDKDTMLFHVQGPKQRPGQIRFPVKREKRPFMDMLTWWFPGVSTSGATLALHWDTVYVPLQLRVTPSYTRVVDADAARRIAGVYQVQLEPEPVSRDTTLVAPIETSPTNVTLTIRQQGSELHAVMDPPLSQVEDGYRDWILLPIKGGWFNLGRMLKGELVEIAFYYMVQFDPAGDQAKSFEIRAPNDQVLGKGTRRQAP